MKFKLDGVAGASSELNDALKKIDKLRRKIVASAVESIALDAKRSIATHQSKGKTYKKENPNRIHTASLPGFAPNQDTGELGRSIITSIYNNYEHADVGVPEGEMGERAVKLEYGTPQVLPRPFMQPAVNKHKVKFVEEIEALEI